MRATELIGHGALLADSTLDLVAVIPVVRQCRIDIGERDGRVLVHDLIHGHAELLVPEGNVLHANSMPRDACLGPALAGNNFNVLPDRVYHQPHPLPVVQNCTLNIWHSRGMTPATLRVRLTYHTWNASVTFPLLSVLGANSLRIRPLEKTVING